MAESLRKNPQPVNMVLGGVDEDEGPSVYYLDYLGTLAKVPYTSQGYGSFFISGLLQRRWRVRDRILKRGYYAVRLFGRFAVTAS